MVDDDEHIVKIVQDLLEASGYQVVAACDGEAALGKYHAEKPNLIILDIMLPGLDGYLVAKMIREDEIAQAKKQAPIIMLTARTSKEDEKQGYLSGSDLYMRKPFDGAGLVEMVGLCLKSQQKAQDQPETKTIKLPPLPF